MGLTPFACNPSTYASGLASKLVMGRSIEVRTFFLELPNLLRCKTSLLHDNIQDGKEQRTVRFTAELEVELNAMKINIFDTNTFGN